MSNTNIDHDNERIHEIRGLMIASQNDLLRMMGNASAQRDAEKAIGNEEASSFHSGNVYAFEYACKHLTNILEKTE